MEKENKILVLCGQTATGKTDLAFRLARIINGELVSADSRQLYRHLDVGTGKDLGERFIFHIVNINNKNDSMQVGYYSDGKNQIWGYDLAESSEEFSVSQYLIYAKQILNNIWERKKIPIVVGGTGLYVKALIDGIGTLDIPRNEKLRLDLTNQSVEKLTLILKKSDLNKYEKMNHSDRRNPRRLIRAIEVASFDRKKPEVGVPGVKSNLQVLFVGLRAPKNYLRKRIIKRVEARVSRDLEGEIKSLLANGVSWDMQSMNTLGYKEWKEYFEGKIPVEEVVKIWTLHEIQYAKRQMTWFKKDSRINWFDISNPDYCRAVENLVSKWYSK